MYWILKYIRLMEIIMPANHAAEKITIPVLSFLSK